MAGGGDPRLWGGKASVGQEGAEVQDLVGVAPEQHVHAAEDTRVDACAISLIACVARPPISSLSYSVSSSSSLPVTWHRAQQRSAVVLTLGHQPLGLGRAQEVWRSSYAYDERLAVSLSSAGNEHDRRPGRLRSIVADDDHGSAAYGRRVKSSVDDCPALETCKQDRRKHVRVSAVAQV